MLCVLFFLLGKIEVKILTRKNIEEAGDQWLTEEDTKSFRELLINLLVTKVTETFYKVYLKFWSITFCTVGLCLSVCVYLIELIYYSKNSVWTSFSDLSLQTGGTEEVYKEQKRQQELENNYRFVWGESQEESQASSTSDPDDVDIWAHWLQSVHI